MEMGRQVMPTIAVIVMVVTHALPATSRTRLVNNGYEGVVVAISPSVDEGQASEIINAIQETISDASEVLFKATRQRAFFREVSILLPSTWTNTTADDIAINENFEESDVRVDVSTAVYGNQPYTEKPGGCMIPGRYVHLTPEYLTDDNEANQWGPRDKTFVHEWAKLRWGVFDEIGYPNDKIYPLFHFTTNAAEKIVLNPNYCADKKLKGGISWPEGEFKSEKLRFAPEEDQEAVSSLMSFYQIANVEQFCDSNTSRHMADVPNKQNGKCGRSVWDVIMSHPDFANGSNTPNANLTTTEFRVLSQEEAKFALVIDYSNSMSDYAMMMKIQMTVRRWILYEVPLGSSVSIIKFGDSAKLQAGLTLIEDDDSRKDLAKLVDTSLRDGTSIGAGVNLAVSQALRGEKNAVILLITDGEENSLPYIRHVKEYLKDSGIRVVTIAFGPNADSNLESLAQLTSGKTFADTETGGHLLDGFYSALPYQPGYETDSNIKIHEYRGTNQTVRSSFIVDASVGRELMFFLETRTSKSPREGPSLFRPDGSLVKTLAFNSMIRSFTITVPLAEAGEWTWSVDLTGSQDSYAEVDIVTKARSKTIQPTRAFAWTSAGTNAVDASVEPVTIFAKVQQGNSAIVGATVRATISLASDATKEIVVDLLDKGVGADSQAGDGIYSRFLTEYPSTGRYVVKVEAWSNGSAFINNGVNTNERATKSYLRSPRAIPSNTIKTSVYCCGFEVPFDMEKATPTGRFSRIVSGGSFKVNKIPEKGDTLPPSRVSDLWATAISTSRLRLTWTATGDDLDTGTVSAYEIHLSSDGVPDNTESKVILTQNDSKNLTELLVASGGAINLTLKLAEAMKFDKLYRVNVYAIDDAGRKSPMSNAAKVFIPAPENGGPPALTIGIIALSCAGLVAWFS